MRDSKSLSLLVLSSILLILSMVLLGSLGYQYYQQLKPQDKQPVAQNTPPTTTKPVIAPASNFTRDSLLKVYQSAISSLDNRADIKTRIADSLNTNLEGNLKEFTKLKEEIAVLLQTKNSTADMDLAGKKITELQQKIQQLSYRNADVEDENKKLHALLNQLSKEAAGAEQNTKQAAAENKNTGNKAAASSAVSTANLNLWAMANDDQNREVPTTEAGKTDRLVGTFVIKNNSNNNRCDIMVVVVQPDGTILQKSDWESGMFETNEGKKIYSYKFHCEAAKGESKQLNFSLSADKYQKGNYTLQIFHNGVMIGKVFKNLS